MFCAIFLYFDREPSLFMYFVYLSGVRYFSPSPKKTHFCALVLPRLLLMWDYLISVVNRIYEFPFVRLFLTCCRLFRSILTLLFFLRCWLMLDESFVNRCIMDRSINDGWVVYGFIIDDLFLWNLKIDRCPNRLIHTDLSTQMLSILSLWKITLRLHLLIHSIYMLCNILT